MKSLLGLILGVPIKSPIYPRRYATGRRRRPTGDRLLLVMCVGKVVVYN